MTINDMQCPNCDNVTQYAGNCQCCGCSLPEHFTPAKSLHPNKRLVKSAVGLDARLWRLLARMNSGIYNPSIESVGKGEIPLIVIIPHKTKLHSSFKELLRIPPSESDKVKYDIVTGRILLRHIKNLDKKCIINYPSITRVSAGTGFEGGRKTSRSIAQELGVAIHRKPAAGPANPVRVTVGVIDFGIDFAHSHFLMNGRTRIKAIWDQSGIKKKGNSPVKYGRLYRSAEINNALKAEDPYKALGYSPPVDSLYDTGAHGTYVADIAAGSGFGGQSAGFAPGAEIIFVDLARTPSHNFVGCRYGDSAQLLEAVDFILRESGDKPCVINISIGSNDGPHDGITAVELGIDRLIERKKKCAVVIAGGNTRDQRLHASGAVEPGRMLDLLWYVPPYDMTSNEIELWYPMSEGLSVQILDPDNAPVTDPIGPGNNVDVPLGSGGRIMVMHRASDRTHECFGGEMKGVVYVFYERFDGYLKKGRWKLRLRNKADKAITFDAWIERDERGQSVFVDPADGTYDINEDNTLNSIAHGRNTIVVGSCRHSKKSQEDSPFTSFNRRLNKPDILAPGENIMAARSMTSVLRFRQTGTSMSAAVITGDIARKISEGNDPDYCRVKADLEKKSEPPVIGDSITPTFRFLRRSDE